METKKTTTQCQCHVGVTSSGVDECPVHGTMMTTSHDSKHWLPGNTWPTGNTNVITDDITAKSSLEDVSNTKRMKDEAGRYYGMLKLIVPLALVGFLLHIPTVVTSIICGRLNSTVSQSATSLAMSTSNYAGFSFILGLLTAYESLGSQALGAGKRSRLGLITIRSLVLSLIVSCYVVVIWFYSDSFFNLITSTKGRVNEEAGFLLRLYTFALPFFCIDSVLTKYLIISGFISETLLIRFTSVILHVTLSWLTIFTADLGLLGAGLTLITTEVVSTILILITIRYLGLERDLVSNLNYEAFKGWGSILKLGGGGVIMILSMSLGIEAVILYLSVDDIDMYDAFLQLQQYQQFFFHLYHGFTVAGTIITGRNVGSQDFVKARKDTQYFCGFSVLAGLLFAGITLLLRYQVAVVLSETPAVEELMRRYLYVYCGYVILDCTQVSMSGILRGLGKQGVGAVICSVFFVVAVVMGYVFVETLDWGGMGAWGALTVASAAALVGMSLVVYHVDWVLEVNRSLENLGLLNRNLVRMRALQVRDQHHQQWGGGGGAVGQDVGQDFVLVENESAPLFKKADTWNVCDREARTGLTTAGVSVGVVVALVIVRCVI